MNPLYVFRKKVQDRFTKCVEETVMEVQVEMEAIPTEALERGMELWADQQKLIKIGDHSRHFRVHRPRVTHSIQVGASRDLRPMGNPLNTPLQWRRRG